MRRESFLLPAALAMALTMTAALTANADDPDATVQEAEQGEAPIAAVPPAQAPKSAPPETLTPAAPPVASIPMADPDPLDMVRPVGGAAAGCACGVPCGIAGTVGSAAGVGGAVGILSGLPPVVAIFGLMTGALVGVPAMACAGPCSVVGATTGTLAGAQWAGRRGRVIPTLVASLPAFFVALAGSLVGAIATGGFLNAVIGMNPGELRSWGAVMVLAVLLTVFSGPLAAILAVSAHTFFGNPSLDEEGPDDVDEAQAPPSVRPTPRLAALAPSGTMRF